MDDSKKKDVLAQGENLLWDYLRNELEKTGQGESALYLKHFLMAQPMEPAVRGELIKVPFEMFHRVSDYSIKLDAMDGQVMGWHFGLLSENPGKDVAADELLKAAKEEANPPPGSVLAVSEYDQIGGNPVFVARWEHEEAGIPVERDFIHVLVNGKTGKPYSLSRKWHGLEFNPTER
jgi:hypothetical protein